MLVIAYFDVSFHVRYGSGALTGLPRWLLRELIEDAYGESPPPPGIHHFVARPADIKQDFAGFCRNLLNFGTFQQDLSIID